MMTCAKLVDLHNDFDFVFSVYGIKWYVGSNGWPTLYSVVFPSFLYPSIISLTSYHHLDIRNINNNLAR